ncbi:MAG TPA: TAT-variant-translocated molybdopterin oxidoreductase, partial [Tepidisphaeraceae bacterium]|nr:TAT-variant-translocated molybdopterin oxidoreductase [Tepidisphaeraceae bacterium]
MLEYWQSLEQLANSPETLERISREFPDYQPEQIISLSRRRFMKLMSASMALAGITLTGCRRWPKEELAPYSSNPRESTPGTAQHFATVYEIGGVGHGLLVTSYDGRPIKIEGNPSHPYSKTFDGKLGAADAFAQASLLELYDPDRSRFPVNRTAASPRQASWVEFESMMASLSPLDGKGFAVLSEATSSPSVLALRDEILKSRPQAQWFEHEPIVQQTSRKVLDLTNADVVVLLDSDLFGAHPAHVRYANDWAKRRRSADEHRGMNRMYMAESALTITGSVADERIGVRPSRLGHIAMAVAARLGVSGSVAPANLSPEEIKFVDHASADLKNNGVINAGDHLPVEIQQIVDAINQSIGAVGKRVTHLQAPANPAQSISKLSEQIKSGAITSVLIIGGNPGYNAPADLDFASVLSSVPKSVHLSLHDNETSRRCKWHVPRAHYLESWGDARAWDGTASIQQPLILPLFDGKSVIEILALLTSSAGKSPRDIVRRTFATLTGTDSDKAFNQALQDGVVPTSQYKTAALQSSSLSAAMPAETRGFELRFLPDQKVLDGRFANNGWLQELPDSLTKLTWDNAALLSKKDADDLGVTNGDMIRISVGDRSLEIAAFILPGQPIGVIGLPLGYGRSAAGRVGNGVGFNAYVLRTVTGSTYLSGATVARTGTTYNFSTTQEHHIIDEIGFKGREERIGEKGHSGPIIREATLAEYEKNPRAAHEGQHEAIPLPLFQPPSQFNNPNAWGMAIDMNACIGCNACVVACQAENNIPIVGKDQVANGREMHWLRVDRYFKGTADDRNPEIAFQPMMCVHCENAPCEQVCPVAATTHDSEGLNVMVYNRCIGTRYCSNNCPYKVRRFNYFDWHS